MNSRISTAIAALIANLAVCAAPAFADWNPTNPVDQTAAKWVQLPNLTATGLDVLDNTHESIGNIWVTLADDFLCTQSGPITDAHIWGSWLNNVLPTSAVGGLPDPGLLAFKISFWSDQQPTAETPFSHPSQPLWTAFFHPGQFQVSTNVVSAAEQFYEPNFRQIIGGDSQVYQYNFPNLVDSTGKQFVQTAGTIYWMEVQTDVLNLPFTPVATFGWKTADPNIPPLTYVPDKQYSFMDDAVFGDTGNFGFLPAFWDDMHYPPGHPLEGQSIDLSFVLTVPEPSTMAMAGLGMVALVGLVYRRAGKS